MARVVKLNIHYKELKVRTKSTAIYLGNATLLLLVLNFRFTELNLSKGLLLNFSYLQIACSFLLALSVFLARTVYRYRPTKSTYEKLPTVTICIPARNETQDLPECIEQALGSTYPKLEIIVLDDCSHDKTPEIIKQYAHAGVRFIKGHAPSDDWLAKNSAYDRLAQEAKGDILLFTGVDIRLKPDSVNELVSQLNTDSMISVLPKRTPDSEDTFFIQPIRYWWELGLWRFRLISPPVLSSCWAIRADELKRIGGFTGVKKAVEPEAVFAKQFSKEKKYAFLVSNEQVGVTSQKPPDQQYRTAHRVRYIQLQRRPELVLATVTLELLLLLTPYILFIWAVFSGYGDLAITSLVSILFLSLANSEVYKLALKKYWVSGFFAVPFLVVFDITLMLKSMYSYEFSKVIWKERNICIPLLTVEKNLPKI